MQQPTRQQPLMAGNTMEALGHVPRLPVLHGGRVRGLSLLFIEQLMKDVQRLREEEGDPTPDGKPPLPCQYLMRSHSRGL